MASAHAILAAMSGARSAVPRAPGAHELRLARGGLAQQISLVTATVAGLIVITAIARTRSVTEFGLYGLLISLAGYMLIAQSSVEGAALKSLGSAQSQTDRDRAFSIALILYTVIGILAAGMVLGIGALLQQSLRIPSALHHQAVRAVVALAVVTACGWPLKIFQDVLRGTRRLVESAVTEVFAYLAFGIASITCIAAHAPLWILAAVGGSIPLLIGSCACATFLLISLEHRFRPPLVDRASIRHFTSFSAYLFLLGISSLVVYSIDRLVLATFRSARAVGLYEGPVRAP